MLVLNKLLRKNLYKRLKCYQQFQMKNNKIFFKNQYKDMKIS